jgi:uncharacterized protein (DUF2236 family)
MTPATLERHRLAIRRRLTASGASRPGPGTVTWTVNQEVLVVAGWARAILLQLAHPSVGNGVADHSRFKRTLGSGLRRLSATVAAMRSLMFGTDDQAIEAAARINSIHDRVTGPGYSAHDPELLRWVHATLVDSIPRTYDLLISGLSRRDRDGYCAEAGIMSPLLDIPAGLLPANTADLDDYMTSMLESGTLRVTDRARAIGRAVLFPPGWRWLWPLFRPMQLVTVGSLPAPIRDAYGFTWTIRDERALARWTRAIRAIVRVTPPMLRRWPASRRSDDRGVGEHAALQTEEHNGGVEEHSALHARIKTS